tara:strand:+ start:292 stop:726 length:435 start_codon:yes stop_codon:yes gene_type:complete
MLNQIMKDQQRKESIIQIFNDDFKYIEDIKKICFESDMKIIDSEYSILSEALDFIADEVTEGKDIEEVECYEFIDKYMLIYTYDFTSWLKEIGTEYTDQALEEYGEFKTTTDLLIKGYSFHMEKMFFIALDIATHLQNKESEVK